MGPQDGSDDDLPPLDVDVPDDARELDPDLLALRRERRSAARQQRVLRVFRTRRYQQYGVSGPALFVALAVVALFGTLFAVLGPTRSDRARPEPLAVGDRDLIAPATLLTSRGRRVESTTIRPAVLALVRPDCRCDEALADVAGEARTYGLDLVLVVDRARDRPAAAPPFTITLEQLEGDLFDTYRASGLTLVLLAADGTVREVVHDVRPGQSLGADLQPLGT